VRRMGPGFSKCTAGGARGPGSGVRRSSTGDFFCRPLAFDTAYSLQAGATTPWTPDPSGLYQLGGAAVCGVGCRCKGGLGYTQRPAVGAHNKSMSTYMLRNKKTRNLPSKLSTTSCIESVLDGSAGLRG
jgi:hypothetical protein